MGLSLVSAPASEPITVDEAAVHLRISTSPITDATYIGTLITAARQYAEGFTRRSFVTQTWDYTLPEFPYWKLELPIQPVQSVTSVSYVNEAGSTLTFVDSSVSPETPKYDVVTDGPRTYLTPKYNLDWPATRIHNNAVTVRFVAGYTTVPEDIKQALKILVAHWYEVREPNVIGTSVAQVPMSVEALLSQYQLRGFG